MPTEINIEVAIAFPSEQRVKSLQLAAGSTARQALELSGFIADHRELGNNYAIGIFGKVLDDPNSYELISGDRVEIYRPLAKK